jgi:hypothetical protein
MTFNIQPSAEFVRLTAELEALDARDMPLMTALGQDGLPPDEKRELIAQMTQIMKERHHVHQALKATPEQQYLDQIQADEMATCDQETAAELERRGRMVTILSLNPDGCQDIDEAIREHSFSDTAQTDGWLPFGPGTDEPLSVVADMHRMSPGQVAKCLRAMADRIEEDGLTVYRGPVPAWWNPQANFDDSVWCADEKMDGTFQHHRYLRNPPD